MKILEEVLKIFMLLRGRGRVSEKYQLPTARIHFIFPRGGIKCTNSQTQMPYFWVIIR
jgi:hypothetical protein